VDAAQLARDPASLLLALSRRRGDIVHLRGAPEPSYLVNTPAGVEHVLVSGAARYSKATSSNEMFRTAVADGLLTLEGESWRRERRLVQPFFRSLGPTALAPAMSASLALLAARWGALAGTGEPIDLAHDMLALALGFTAQLLFGVELGDRADELAVSLDQALRLLTAPSEPEFEHARETVHGLIESLIDRRRREPGARGDLLSVLMSAPREGDRRASAPSLLDQIITYLLAGAETTGSALAWTLYLISAHPAERSRLERESGGARMVVQESLRLYPPGWILGRRALDSDQIGTVDVEPGASVAVSPYTMHRHPGYWSAPDEFQPERFHPTRAARPRRFSYLPFGAGPRTCIGAQLALAEATTVVAGIVQRFRLTPMAQPQPEGRFVLRPHGGLPVTVERRPV
jgi:enediyne biosynthesis protein E7